MPVWFMRQAGRSLPEYRAARGPGSILDAIAQPELVAELTRQPVDRYGTDAAIFFSDIVVPAAAVGFGVDVAPGHRTRWWPSRSGRPPTSPGSGRSSPRSTPPTSSRPCGMLAETLEVPLIGFAGGPFTVASYLVEGGPSKNFTKVKALMHGEPGLWHDLVERLTDMALASLRSQLDAGASAVQVFDSWAGILTPRHYARAGAAGHPAALRRARGLPPGHPDHPLRRGHRRAARPDGHGRHLGGGRRLAGAARRGPAAGRARHRRPGQPRPGPVPRHAGRWRRPRPARCSTGPAPPPATSSTSATGSCPRPIPAILEQVVGAGPRRGPGRRGAPR